MLTNVRTWKNLFIKICPVMGYHPLFLDKRRHLHYPFKWFLSIRHEDWSFDSLLPNDQDVVVKLLAVAPLDAQAVISEFVVREFFKIFVVILMCFVYFM